jgi:multidrug transporter EmrE-like cation transporter
MLKKSRIGITDFGVSSYLNLWFIGGLCFYGINVLLFAKALDKIPVSIAYPVLAGIGFILLSITSYLIFHEVLKWQQWIGLIFILGGIIFVSK